MLRTCSKNAMCLVKCSSMKDHLSTSLTMFQCESTAISTNFQCFQAGLGLIWKNNMDYKVLKKKREGPSIAGNILFAFYTEISNKSSCSINDNLMLQNFESHHPFLAAGKKEKYIKKGNTLFKTNNTLESKLMNDHLYLVKPINVEFFNLPILA